VTKSKVQIKYYVKCGGSFGMLITVATALLLLLQFATPIGRIVGFPCLLVTISDCVYVVGCVSGWGGE